MPHNEDGVGGAHLYMPWWLDNKKLDFPRGYHIEIGGGRRMPGAGFIGSIHAYTGVEASGTPISFGGYGKKLKHDYRRLYGSTVSFAGRGEMVPNEDSYCELDPRVVDKWGIPVLRFHFKWSDYEIKQAKHMQETFRAIIQEMGGTPLSPMPTAANELRPRGRRADHPRARRHAHGQRSEHVGAQQELPGARREERVRRRRRAVRVAGRQELHVDDPRAGDAHQRTTSPTSARQGTILDACDASSIADRCSQLLGVGAGRGRVHVDRRRGGAGRAGRAGGARGRAKPAPPSSRSSSPRTSTRPSACWSTSSSRRTSGPAAPPTPACRSSWTS